METKNKKNCKECGSEGYKIIDEKCEVCRILEGIGSLNPIIAAIHRLSCKINVIDNIHNKKMNKEAN